MQKIMEFHGKNFMEISWEFHRNRIERNFVEIL